MTQAHHIRLHQLRALVAVVEHGSIRAAARQLNVSQAAATKSLKGLEDAAGVALLNRKASGVVLTDAGTRLMSRARLVTRQIDLAAAELAEQKSSGQVGVCVGVTPLVAITVLGEAMRHFRKRHPNTPVQVMEGLVSRVLPALRDGTLDFAILANSGDLGAEFNIQPISQEPQHVVAHKIHPLAKAKRLSQLGGAEWAMAGIVSTEKMHGPGWLGKVFANAGLPVPSLVTRCDAMPAIAMVRSADALSVFPQSLLEHESRNGIVRIPIEGLELPELSLVQVALAETQFTGPAGYLAQCLQDACAKGA
jgi:LysR family transcriptional regulator, regulator of abg operon